MLLMLIWFGARLQLDLDEAKKFAEALKNNIQINC